MQTNGNGGQKMSGFGLYVFKLMASRGITRQKELRFWLKTNGYETTPQNLSNWLHGTHPPQRFVQCLVEALALNAAEESELYRKYVWESRLSA